MYGIDLSEHRAKSDDLSKEKVALARRHAALVTSHGGKQRSCRGVKCHTFHLIAVRRAHGQPRPRRQWLRHLANAAASARD